MPDTATETPPRRDTSCPNCGAPAERGQLVCLECGGRVALDYRRPYGWKLPVAIVGAVVLVFAAGFAAALSAIDDEADSDARRSAGKVAAERAAAREPRGDEKPAEPRAKKAAEAPAGRVTAGTRPKRRGGVVLWPEATGFSVIIGSTEDARSARGLARAAGRAGVPAGVLSTDDYRGLGSNLHLVFAGVYESRARAERAARGFARRYPGAYPQRVKPR